MSDVDCRAEQLNQQIFDGSTDYVHLEDFLKKKGIDVRYINSDVLDGYLRWDKNVHKPVIAVSVTGNASVRMRFTMAHELSHLVLDYKWEPGKDNSKLKRELEKKDILSVLAYRNKADYTPEERQKEERADNFAASFLMPISKMKKLVKESIENDEAADDLVAKVKNEFNVSWPAAFRRTHNVVEQLAQNYGKK